MAVIKCVSRTIVILLQDYDSINQVRSIGRGTGMKV